MTVNLMIEWLIVLLISMAVPQQDQVKLESAIERGDLIALKEVVMSDPSALRRLLPKSRMPSLHRAIQLQKPKVVEFLLESGVSVDSKNSQKLTPLHLAIKAKNSEVVDLILERSTNLDHQDSSGRTPLMYAVQYQHNPVSVAEKLLAAGADPSMTNSSQQTALHVACYYRREDCARKLIEAGVGLEDRDKSENTPLLCSFYSSAEFVKYLLDKGAKTDVVNRQGMSALHVASQVGRIDMVQLVIDRFDDLNIADKNGRTPLLMAVATSNTKLVKLFLERGASPDGKKSSKVTATSRPLLMASAIGHAEIVKLVLDAGASVSVLDSNGDGALHFAASAQGVLFNGRKGLDQAAKRFLDVLMLLLDRGADPNKKNASRKTPLAVAVGQDFFPAIELLVGKTRRLDFEVTTASKFHWAARNGLIESMKRLISLEGKRPIKALVSVDELGRTPLFVAAEFGHADIVDLLIAQTMELDVSNANGISIMGMAASKGHANVVRSLVGAGADFSRKDDSGHSPLHIAAWSGNADIVAVLLENISRSDLKTQSGYTPLHAAAWNGHSSVIEQLLSAGAVVDAGDSDGWTALHKAAYRGHVDAVAKLLSAGADVARKNIVGMTAMEMAEGNKCKEVVELLKLPK